MKDPELLQQEQSNPGDGNNAIFKEAVPKGTDWLERADTLLLPSYSYIPREEKYASENCI